MKAQGANFVLNAAPKAVEKVEGSYLLTCGESTTIKTDYILCAVGRKANVEGLGLEELGIKASNKGIVVDNHLRTAVKHIYASGDVIDKKIPKLTPTAEFESNYIALDILNPLNGAISYPAVPNLVFTLPRIGQVGITEEEARADSANYRVEEAPFGMTMGWLNKAETDAHMTFIFDKANHLVGASVISEDAGVYLDFLTLIINQKTKAQDLAKMIFAFPTITYGLVGTLTPLMLKK